MYSSSILISKGLRFLKERDGINHIGKRESIQYAIHPALASILSRNHLRVVHVGVHLSISIQEPHTHLFGSFGSILLLARQVICQGERAYRLCHLRQFVAVVLLQLRIGHTIPADVW